MCYAVEARACSIRTSFAPTNFHDYTKKAMALSPQQFSNEQRVLRMPGLSSFYSFEVFWCFNIGSLNGKSMELCAKLLRRKVGICCIQEMRWRGMGSKFLDSLGRRFKLW